jgi:SPP1 family predicted phage head-tail adaptor
MLWRDVVELGNATETETLGEVTSTYIWRTVFANKKGVRQSEFYQASATGLKPELVFVVRSEEYKNDERLKHNNKEYAIVRTYDKGETTEITVQTYVGSDV